MDGFEHRSGIRKAIGTIASGALLALVVAASGCGGGGSDKSAPPPAPVSAKPSAGGGLVTAEGTKGLVGPASRATKGGTSGSDKTGRIAPGSNKPPPGKNKNGVGAQEECPGSDITPTGDNLDTVNDRILCLVNFERASAGLSKLDANSQLQQAAQGMAARMVSEQFFSHTTPDGKSVVDRVEPTGYIPSSGDWVVGENLAWGNGALSTPQAIVNGWMNSPGHRANILASDYKDIGLAAALGAPSSSVSGGTVYVNNFGAKSGANTNATLPAEGGAAGAGGNDQATAAAAAKAKAKKKSRKKRRRRRH